MNKTKNIKKEAKSTKSEKTGEEYVLEVKNLRKSFDKLVVIKDISLTLKKGENLVVLGKSGHGKSVLIKCIVGLLQPDSGYIKILDKEILKLNPDELEELRTRIGFLFQGGALYDSMTVRDNLEFPLKRQDNGLNKEEINSLVEEVLEAVGLLEAIDKMPSDLSGGMRKRVALARALMLKPEIILYDEPTTGLDPITSTEISELIIAIKEKFHTSSIIITHDLSCARITHDRITVLKEGEFVAEGTFEERGNRMMNLCYRFLKTINNG